MPPSSFPSSQTETPALHRINTHPTLSPFRRRVYRILLSIPPGRWTTYAALARYIGSTTNDKTRKKNPLTPSRSQAPRKGSGSARAVGTAMRTNPFAPHVPCHRVLAADGTLGGYMGEGPSSGGRNLQRKREMLEGEGVVFVDEQGKAKGRKGPRAQGECFVDFAG